MPELPDITIYLESLKSRIVGRRLERVVIRSPFLLRTVEPTVDSFEGLEVTSVHRLGKRIVWEFPHMRYLVIHLMIAGRILWRKPGMLPRGKIDLAGFQFADGTVLLTEAGTKKRAGLWAVKGEGSLRRHDPGGVDVLACNFDEFALALRRVNRTLKRALTDPHIVDGIGNAYSDEILLAARLSPFKKTQSMSDDECARLYAAARDTLTRWTESLRREFAGRFPGPGEITAFRPDFAVHGRFGKPCPVCGSPVQRVIYAENEMNYCARCQTDGKVLADRSLSRLLRDDWPKTIEELEEHA